MSEPALVVPPPSKTRTEELKSQIDSLTEIYNRVQNLRSIPLVLLKLPARDDNAALPAQSFMVEFNQLNSVAEAVKSEAIQNALTAAKDSERSDKTGIHFIGRRENRKRKRPSFPASPQPYIPPEKKSQSLFPPFADEEPALTRPHLNEYAKEFNRTNDTAAKLHIWRSTRNAPAPTNPIILRLTLPDILAAYIVLLVSESENLVVETVRAFGPREKKSPHSQSSYIVFQNISQQLATMINSHPTVSLQSLMHLLLSYNGLFKDKCAGCLRVLSTELYIPPVLRIWSDGRWEPRHSTCRYT